MANTPVTGVLLDTKRNRVSTKTLNGTLDGYYAALNCDMFDIATRNIGGKYFDIYCDDIGLLYDDVQISAISSEWEPMLVGNLFICSHNEEGDAVSLSEDDINLIEKRIKIIINPATLKAEPVIVCDY